VLIDITVKGTTTEVEIDPDLSKFTLQETVRLEEALGDDVFDTLMGGAGREYEIPSRPSILQALIWCKLATLYPTLGRYDFDLDLSDLGELMAKKGGPVDVPMDVDGEVTTAVVEVVPPGNV